jgi:hypothetical protein
VGASSVTGTGHGSAEGPIRRFDPMGFGKIWQKTADIPAVRIDGQNYRIEVEGATGAGTVIQEMHKITAVETLQGYFLLSQIPIDPTAVTVDIYRGPRQVNKKVIGSSGAIPDFDVLNQNQLHFNNNGGATDLREYITTDDILIMVYEY